MLHPVEDSVLKNNPKFAALHATLTNSLLKSDGSTRNHANLREYEAAAQELKTLQTCSIKYNLIKQSLMTLDPSMTISKSANTALSEDLLEIITLLSLQLSSPLPPSTVQTLSASHTLSILPEYIPNISELISRYLQNQAIFLVRLMHPTANASFLHRSIPKLENKVQTLQQSVASKKEALEKDRLKLISQACAVLTSYQTATALVIQMLESTKHSQHSRASKSHAEFVATTSVSELWKVRIMAAKAKGMVYNEETKDALRNYQIHLNDAQLRLEQKKRDVERVLWGYGIGREGEEGARKVAVMKEVARVWVGVNREVEEMRRDLEKLLG